MKKIDFLFQYAIFNLICVLYLSIDLFLEPSNEGIIEVLSQALFIIVFMKLNIVIQLFQFGYLLLFSVCYLISFIFFSWLFGLIDNKQQYFRVIFSFVVSCVSMLFIIHFFQFNYLFIISICYLALFVAFSWLFDFINKKKRYLRIIISFVTSFILLLIEMYLLGLSNY